MQLPVTMKVMVLEEPKELLVLKTVPLPVPLPQQVLIKVISCGVCKTDPHIIDGELTQPELPLIPGHEIVSIVVLTGNNVMSLKEGDLVGVPWLGYTCGTCKYCLNEQRISAIMPASPGTRLMVAMQNILLPMKNIVSRFHPCTAMRLVRRCFVQGLSVTVLTT